MSKFKATVFFMYTQSDDIILFTVVKKRQILWNKQMSNFGFPKLIYKFNMIPLGNLIYPFGATIWKYRYARIGF